MSRLRKFAGSDEGSVTGAVLNPYAPSAKTTTSALATTSEETAQTGTGTAVTTVTAVSTVFNPHDATELTFGKDDEPEMYAALGIKRLRDRKDYSKYDRWAETGTISA